MKLTVSIQVFPFCILLSLATAFPVRNTREVTTPSVCEIRQFENSEIAPRKDNLGQCIEVKSTVVPASLRMNCNDPGSNQSYKLHTFSSVNCAEEDAIYSKTISIRNQENNQRFAIINERRPICSFRLHDNAIDPVKITFRSAHSHITYNNTRVNNACVENLCGEGPDVLPKYAASVDLHEVEDGSEANNSVDLFSDNLCQQRIQNEGEFGVVSGTDLVSLTRLNSTTVQSFKVTL